MAVKPIEHIAIKEECRKQGVEVFSIFSYNTENRREDSTVKEIIFKSRLKRDEVLAVAIVYFKAIGYVGKVNVIPLQPEYFRASLSNRLRY
ncbi:MULTISPECIES: hypothetical protein [Deinococcus]|uniref:Uncharacterized protein n=1 Tax=Deinococcus rufus TaxID=2136097 RepID=A0ABV7Z7Q8_9DEIO|nr:hypothetical protein [Deinococcus sp. AB2017081]WQE94419.1 hypothetical protein U2P90_13520 [Deinococcus sp. AB2017081]